MKPKHTKNERQIFRRLHKTELYISISLDMRLAKYVPCQDLEEHLQLA